MDKQEMVDYIAKCSSATANEADVRRFYSTKNENEVREDFQKLLIGEKQRIVAADAETQKARQAAAEAQQQAAEALEKVRFLQICQVVVDGKVVANNQANFVELRAWPLLHQGEVFGAAMFEKALKDNPSLKFRIVWQEYISPSAEKQHNAQVEASTRATFHTLARDYDLSRCESNVQAILGHFPDGADAFTIGTALQNQELNLAPCNKAEHLEYTKELEAEYARKWKSLPLHEMRKRSQECNSEREALLARHFWKERGVLTKQDEHEARQQSIKTQESTLGFPPMPEFLGETKLDAAYLRGCSRNQLMDAVRRFGAFQVNQRLVQS